MTGAPETLIKDPVFQLNLVLWLVQPAPEGAPTSPVLRNAGYHVMAVSRRLHPPPDMRGKLAAVAGSGDAPAPDVLLAHAGQPSDPTILVIECKASGFSANSSTAKQARKLLAVGADVSAPLGLATGQPRPGHLTYLTVLNEQHRLRETLASLAEEVAAADLPVAAKGVLGVERRDDGIYVDRGVDEAWPPPMEGVATPTRVVQAALGDDPRPLYLIPWDPGVTQTDEQAAWCRALLASRILNEAISRVGRMEVPGPLVLSAGDLLREATFGVSDRWYARNEVAQVTARSKATVIKALKPLQGDLSLMQSSPADPIQLALPSEDVRDKVIAALEEVDPFAALVPQPPSLFDLLDQAGDEAAGESS